MPESMPGSPGNVPGSPGNVPGSPGNVPGSPGNVTDNPAKMRYEIHQDGAVAGFVTYGREGKVIIFLHTQTDPRFRGEGLAGRLVRASLDDARKRGLDVLPFCPFMRDWIAGHPGYADLVPAPRRAEFGL